MNIYQKIKNSTTIRNHGLDFSLFKQKLCYEKKNDLIINYPQVVKLNDDVNKFQALIPNINFFLINEFLNYNQIH